MMNSSDRHFGRNAVLYFSEHHVGTGKCIFWSLIFCTMMECEWLNFSCLSHEECQWFSIAIGTPGLSPKTCFLLHLTFLHKYERVSSTQSAPAPNQHQHPISESQAAPCKPEMKKPLLQLSCLSQAYTV
eukprot:276821-Pelagomonas_calceolata.AAC.2